LFYCWLTSVQHHVLKGRSPTVKFDIHMQHVVRLSAARADCVLSRAVAPTYVLTSDWRVDHVVISCRLWLTHNRPSQPWLDRVRLGRLALKIARHDSRGVGFALKQADVQGLFTVDMKLNPASTVVQRMLQVCRHALEDHRFACGWHWTKPIPLSPLSSMADKQLPSKSSLRVVS
jgi:hypothetical protein